MTELATHVVYARKLSTGESVLLDRLWASRSRRWLEWACNSANSKGDTEFHWWVGPAPYPMPVTAYHGEEG